MTAPLSRFKVLDLTRVRSGPTAVRQLADWGAEVIQIEAPESVAPGDGFGGPRHGADFQNLHRGKRSLCLDLKRPEGIDILKRLAKQADVVVENFRPDVKKRLGIDYDSLRAINARLVYASISGFGQDGPYAMRPGFDQIAQGMGGIMSVTGLPGQGPVRAGIPIADLSAGLLCAMGILIALLEREQTGQGRWVSTSLLQAQIMMMDFQAARWLFEGVVPEQAGNDHPSMAPMGVYPTRDGYINIASAGDAMWRALCQVVGLQDIQEQEEFSSDRLRTKNRAALRTHLTAALSTRTSAEWIETLNAVGVPSGPIYTMNEVFDDPQVKHLRMAQAVYSPALGEKFVVAQPINIRDAERGAMTGAPERGEHSAEILTALGLTATEIDQMRASGVI